MKSQRSERNVFLMFLGACFVAVMSLLPLVVASQNYSNASQGGTAPARTPASDRPTFEQADRNKDRVVDKSEAGVVPGLSANFERVDRNKDGKLDADEFARAVQFIEARR